MRNLYVYVIFFFSWDNKYEMETKSFDEMGDKGEQHFKGQKNSKANYAVLNSPKK